MSDLDLVLQPSVCSAEGLTLTADNEFLQLGATQEKLVLGPFIPASTGSSKPYSAQTSSASTVTVLVSTTYLRLTSTAQTALLPAVSALGDGDELQVKACATGLEANPDTLLAAGSDHIFDTDPTATSLQIQSDGGFVTLKAVHASSSWETVG